MSNKPTTDTDELFAALRNVDDELEGCGVAGTWALTGAIELITQQQASIAELTHKAQLYDEACALVGTLGHMNVTNAISALRAKIAALESEAAASRTNTRDTESALGRLEQPGEYRKTAEAALPEASGVITDDASVSCHHCGGLGTVFDPYGEARCAPCNGTGRLLAETHSIDGDIDGCGVDGNPISQQQASTAEVLAEFCKIAGWVIQFDEGGRIFAQRERDGLTLWPAVLDSADPIRNR